MMRLEALWRELRHAARSLACNPGFTAAAILTLALGIGANTALFQLVDAIRLRSLPVPRPWELVRIQVEGGNHGFGITEDPYNLTAPLFDEVRRHAGAQVFAWRMVEPRVGESGSAHKARGLVVSGGYFPALGFAPAAGRLLELRDDPPAACPIPPAVLSHGFWRSNFGGDPGAIGRRLMIDGRPVVIAGVAPASFAGLNIGGGFDIALPQCFEPPRRNDLFALTVMARLHPGESARSLTGRLKAASPAILAATAPAGYAADALARYRLFRLEAETARTGVSRLREQYDTLLLLLFGITAILLSIACANLAGLMLARNSTRASEFALRRALGASPGRMILHAAAESLWLSAVGAVAGLLLARLLSGSLLGLMDVDDGPLELDLAIGWRTLAFTGAVTTAASIGVALGAAWRTTRTAAAQSLRAARYGTLQRTLVIAQIALSTILAFGALLFARSFHHLATMDPGFEPRGIQLVHLDMSRVPVPDKAVYGMQRAVLENIRGAAGVRAAASTTNVAIGGGSWLLEILNATAGAKFTWVSPGHFETLGIPLVAGRDLAESDGVAAPRVVVVNEAFAQRYGGAWNALGKTFRTAAEPNYPETEYQIAGVVKDTRYHDLRNAMPAQCYAAAAQRPFAERWPFLYVRAPAGEPMRREIARRIAAVHPAITAEFTGFEAQIRQGLSRERMLAALSVFFGVLALVLAAVGLYGVVSYAMARRRTEIGIRMALGATRSRVVALVLADCAAMLLPGAAAGLLGALALSRSAASLVYGISPRDPATLGAAVAILAAVVLAAAFAPAARAARLDPMTALRSE